MKSHPDPRQRWQMVSSHLFMLNGKTYLIIVDHFEVDELRKDATSETVIDACKVHFANHRASNVFISDNGLQFVSEDFKTFSKERAYMSHHHCSTAKVMERLSQQ